MSSDILTKLLSSSNSQDNNNQQLSNDRLQQLYSLLSNNNNNNGTRAGNGNMQQMLPITDMMKNLGKLMEQFFGSKLFIFSFIAIVLGLLFLCSFCFMLYCCCRSEWCRKRVQQEEERKFKSFR
jgi:hypothetical protein